MVSVWERSGIHGSHTHWHCGHCLRVELHSAVAIYTCVTSTLQMFSTTQARSKSLFVASQLFYSLTYGQITALILCDVLKEVCQTLTKIVQSAVDDPSSMQKVTVSTRYNKRKAIPCGVQSVISI